MKFWFTKNDEVNTQTMMEKVAMNFTVDHHQDDINGIYITLQLDNGHSE